MNKSNLAAAKHQPAELDAVINSDNYCKAALHSQVVAVIKLTASIPFVRTTQNEIRQNEIKLQRRR